jgi:hypothetical protein
MRGGRGSESRVDKELAEWVDRGWQAVGPGRSWRSVETWFRADPGRNDIWVANVTRLGYNVVRQYVVDRCPYPNAYPYPTHPIEAIAVVEHGATVARGTDVVYRWKPSLSEQQPVISVLQAIRNLDSTLQFSYRAGTIVCEVVNAEACKAQLGAILSSGNLTL